MNTLQRDAKQTLLQNTQTFSTVLISWNPLVSYPLFWQPPESFRPPGRFPIETRAHATGAPVRVLLRDRKWSHPASRKERRDHKSDEGSHAKPLRNLSSGAERAIEKLTRKRVVPSREFLCPSVFFVSKRNKRKKRRRRDAEPDPSSARCISIVYPDLETIRARWSHVSCDSLSRTSENFCSVALLPRD